MEEGGPVGGGVAFVEMEVGEGPTEGEVGEGGGVGVVEGVREEGGEVGGGVLEEEKGLKGGAVREVVLEGEEDAFGLAGGTRGVDDDAVVGGEEEGFEVGFGEEEGEGGWCCWWCRLKHVFYCHYRYVRDLGLHCGDLLGGGLGMREHDFGLAALNLMFGCEL